MKRAALVPTLLLLAALLLAGVVHVGLHEPDHDSGQSELCLICHTLGGIALGAGLLGSLWSFLPLLAGRLVPGRCGIAGGFGRWPSRGRSPPPALAL